MPAYYYLAAAWTAIGDKQRAQTSLERAYQSRSNWIIYLQYNPRFDDLRPYPQFQSILKFARSRYCEPVPEIQTAS
jgi:hypothetical protein